MYLSNFARHVDSIFSYKHILSYFEFIFDKSETDRQTDTYTREMMINLN